jgi:hypothetical protein
MSLVDLPCLNNISVEYALPEGKREQPCTEKLLMCSRWQ